MSRDDRLVLAWDHYIRNFSKFDAEKYPHGSYISIKEIDEFLYALQATPNFYPRSNFMIIIPFIVGFILIGLIAGIGGRASGSKAWIAIVVIIIFICMIGGVIYFHKLHNQGLEQRQREFQAVANQFNQKLAPRGVRWSVGECGAWISVDRDINISPVGFTAPQIPMMPIYPQPGTNNF